MAYTNSDRWSVAGTTGSLIIPELWLPELENDLPLLTFWNQFMAKNVDTIQGKGNTIHVSYVQDGSAVTTPLVAGTPIVAVSSTGLGQTDITFAQYGAAENIENLDAFLSNSDVRGVAAVQTARNAMRVRNALVGAVFTGGSNYFTIEGTAAANVVETSGTTADGNSPLLPTHVRAITGALKRKGIAPFADGFYRCIGAPGMFDSIKANAEVYENAARLGISDLYATGEITKFGGVLFIEEMGVDAVTSYGTNGKSCIFGQNAVVGWDNFLRADLIKWYADAGEDFGRASKIGWTGLFGASLTLTASTNSRAWNIYSSY